MKIKGIEFSEETIVGWAEKAGISFEEPKYEFKAGDVAESNQGLKRMILYCRNGLCSFDPNGHEASSKQQEFEVAGYKKIGVISDFIK